jgi:hydroxyacylglutathione hydrolase
VPGTINIPLTRSFNTWAGWLLPYDEDFYLILDDSCAECVENAVKDLAMVGLDRIVGYFGDEAVEAWVAGGRKLDAVWQTNPDELAKELDEVTVLDVRGFYEWEAGHLRDAENIPVGYLADRLEEIPHGRPLVVYCQTGSRSAIAASLLKSQGFDNVSNLTGGYVAWRAAGYEAKRGTASPEPAKIG